MGACTMGIRGCCGHDSRVGEYEFSDVYFDSNHGLSLTSKQINNEAIVKHVRTTAIRGVVLEDEDISTKLKQLEELVHYAPLLKLKVFMS